MHIQKAVKAAPATDTKVKAVNRGRCPDKYVREELVDQQFTESLNRIQIDDDVADWIVGVMNSSTAEERARHEASIKALEL